MKMFRFILVCLLLLWWGATSTAGPDISAPSVSATDINKYETYKVWEGDDGASPPAPLTTITSTHTYFIRNFDGSSDEDLDFDWVAPIDLTAGSTILFRVVCIVSNATAPANGEIVSFQLSGASMGASDSIGATLGTAVSSSYTADGTYAQYEELPTAWSSAVTITDHAAGEIVKVTLNRDADDVDTYGQDIGLYALQTTIAISIISQ